MSAADKCQHTVTQGKDGKLGSWCVACGAKAWEVDDRECQHCAHAKKLIGGWICNRHLMAISPSMHVTFSIEKGSCWESK
jgi:hypothetical protein